MTHALSSNHMPFDPNTLTSITINGIVYTLEDIGGSMRLPGNRAYVCRLKDNNNQQYALKYYNPHTAAIIAAQVYDLARSFRTQNAQLYDFPAFNWTKGRIYIDASNPITRTYSELTHAILMPWIHGELISNIRTAVRAGSKTYSTASVRKIVNNLLESLIQLERNHLAHGDICGSNVFIQDDESVAIIDMDEMYMPGFLRPDTLNKGCGHEGYRFHTGFDSWCAEADRFSTAILIAEILTLSDSSVASDGGIESHFGQHYYIGSLPANNPYLLKMNRILTYIRHTYPEYADLMERAFNAATLTDVPELREWLSSASITPPIMPHPVPAPVEHNGIPINPMVLPKKAYSRSASADRPILIIFLLDISQTMFRNQGASTRIDLALDIMNTSLAYFREFSKSGDQIRPRYHFAVFCYNSKVHNLLSSITTTGIVTIDGFHETAPFTRDKIEKINPKGSTNPNGAETNMTLAFTELHVFLQKHINNYTDSHPPFIFHITDGMNTGNDTELKDAFKAITSMSIPDGNPLIASFYINDMQDLGLITPNFEAEADAETLDAVRLLVDTSSAIPETYVIRHRGIRNLTNATKFVFSYKSDPETLKIAITLAVGTGT